RCPFKAEIRGSNPLGGASTFLKLTPAVCCQFSQLKTDKSAGVFTVLLGNYSGLLCHPRGMLSGIHKIKDKEARRRVDGFLPAIFWQEPQIAGMTTS
ncbi:MAG: hypothetical protein AAB359_05510, partial [Elusimicrobiota bacterium]